MYSVWSSLKYYFALFFVLLLLNGVMSHYFYDNLLNKVGEIQLFLLILFMVSALVVKFFKDKAMMQIPSVVFGSVGIKMMAALIYLLPVILGDDPQKETIALVFMVNYLIYLNFSVIAIVRNK